MQAADLAGSGGALASVLLHRQSASLSSLPGHSQGGTPRMMGTPQLGTPTTSLDKLQRDDMLMHELDQVTHRLHGISLWHARQVRRLNSHLACRDTALCKETVQTSRLLVHSKGMLSRYLLQSLTACRSWRLVLSSTPSRSLQIAPW